MKNFHLYVVVFIAGAAVLAIEILGTRILGPFYGVSLFLWSALITVTLAALSLGYAIGGRWADKGATMFRLSILLAGAGLWLLLIPWLTKPILLISEPFGLRFAVLVAAFILFFPPLTMLGMISPYAIKLKTASLAEVGRTAGNLYAVSTVASVFSALLIGFFLIPNIGVSRLTLMIGFILIITAIFGFVVNRKSKLSLLGTVVVLVVGAVVILNISTDSADPEKGLVYVKQSPYGEIRVLNKENAKYLLIDGGVHTVIDTVTGESQFPYIAVINLTMDFFEKSGHVLLIGLGGGSIIKNFSSAGWSIDAVEIDPEVIEVAQKYFGLKASEGRIFHMDGRQFLTTHRDTYDIVIMDAFGSSSIPFHLVTQESFGLIASHLKPDGIFAINVESNGWHDLIVRSLAATLQQHFDEVLALPTTQLSDQLGNIIIFASNHKLELQRKTYPGLKYKSSMSNQNNQAWNNRFIPDTQNIPILTDDLNPIDVWSEAINNIARKDLHSYFEQRGLSW